MNNRAKSDPGITLPYTGTLHGIVNSSRAGSLAWPLLLLRRSCEYLHAFMPPRLDGGQVLGRRQVGSGWRASAGRRPDV